MRNSLLVALVLFCLTAPAFAGDIFTIYATRVDQNPTDIIDWGQLGPTFTDLATPQSVSSFNGILGLVGNTSGANFQRRDEGNGWNGNFDYGETLVWTEGGGPFAVELATPVSSFGFNIQADTYGAFTATVTALDSSFNTLFTQSFSGTSDASENGSAIFIGMGDLSGVNISEILISTDSGPDDFAINDVSLTTDALTSVPEPGSVTLVGGALLLAGALLRKYKR